jgi:hypothetical protein
LLLPIAPLRVQLSFFPFSFKQMVNNKSIHHMKKQLNIRINPQLKMLCELLDTTPQQVLQDFADNLSLDYRHTNGSDERSMAVEYFMRVGYGMYRFSYEEIEHLFDELNTIRYNFYSYGNSREQEYIRERNRQYQKLFRQWAAEKAKRKGH